MTGTRRSSIAALLAVLALLASCGGDDVATPSTSTGGATTAPTTTEAAPAPGGGAGCDADPAELGERSAHEQVDVAGDDAERWYSRWVPPTYDGEPVPLVIELHGYLSGAAGQAAMSDMGVVADREGFVVVTPQGSGDMPYWNAVPHDDLPDDLAFVEDVLDDVGQSVCIDPDRVYVDGFSNGAFLTSLAACRLADRVAAVAALSGLQDPAGCDPARPMPVLAMHGTEDQLVSFAGPPNPGLEDLTWDEDSTRAFDGLPFGDVRDAAATWASRNGCDAEPSSTAAATHVEVVAYGGCEGGADVELYVLDGAGHTWPGSAFAAASTAILGPATDEIDASDTIWSFFAAHPMG